MALGVDNFVAGLGNAPDMGDEPVLDADIGAVARHAGAVDHHAVLDNQVVTHDAVLGLRPNAGGL